MNIKHLISFILFFSFSPIALSASYEEGREAYLAKDYAKAISILEPLAKNGNPKAQITMGTIYDFGHGVQQNTAKAVSWYEQAAAQGNSSVQHDLGVKYFKGMGISQDYDKAAAWWRMAADNGVAESQYNLGIMYARGLGFDKDSSQAVSWYTKAASQGHPHAQYSLGVMYSFGQGVDQDYKKGLRYFQDAAEQNVAQAQYNLAVLLENGRGTEVDMAGAKKWYTKASENGIDQATERLAQFDNSSTPKSKTKTQEVATKQTTTNSSPAAIDKAAQTAVVETVQQTEKNTQVASATAVTAVAEKSKQVEVAKTEKLSKPSKATLKTEEKIKPQQAKPAAEKVSRLKTIKTPQAKPATTDTRIANHQVISGEMINHFNSPKKTPSASQEVAKIPVAHTITSHSPELLSHQSWIREQVPGHYALQIVAIRQLDKAIEYVQNLDLDGPKHIYKSTMHGRTIYKVIYGNFEDHRASLKGRRALPTKYRDAKPFPRSYEFIQNDIQP